jgi:hypothetical protein
MPQAAQAAQQVQVREVQRTTLQFSLPEAMPPGCKSPLSVFHTDDVDELLPKGNMLHVLCSLLMPKGESVLIDHVTMKSRRSRTMVEVQLSAELSRHFAARGRVDTALRMCNFEPSFTA